MDEIKITIDFILYGPDVNREFMEEMNSFWIHSRIENVDFQLKEIEMQPDLESYGIFRIAGTVGGMAKMFQMIHSFFQSGSSKRIIMTFRCEKGELLRIESLRYDQRSIEMLLSQCLELRKHMISDEDF